MPTNYTKKCEWCGENITLKKRLMLTLGTPSGNLTANRRITWFFCDIRCLRDWVEKMDDIGKVL